MGEENIYEGGASYGISPSYGDSFFGQEYRQPTSSFAVTTDPRSANILKEVSAKLNTGAKSVEITALQPNLFESIPQQHLEEVNRLRKLAGTDLTLHGPLIEASGISKEGVDESRRMQSEIQMAQVMERANKLDPKGNVIVTFHTTSGLPEMMTRNLVQEDGKTKEKVTEMYVINERDGSINVIKPKENYLLNEKPDPKKELAHTNEETWAKQLTQVSYHAMQGKDSILKAFKGESEEEGKSAGSEVIEAYKKFGTEEGQKQLQEMDPLKRQIIEQSMGSLNYGHIYVQDAYAELQGLFNKAWEAVQKSGSDEDKKRLLEYRDRIAKKNKEFGDLTKLPELADEVNKGVALLNSLSKTPATFTPLQEFVIERSSETYSNVALNTYKKFKENAPIISLENPPVGMGIGRAEDMKKLIDESRKKLAEKLVSEAKLDQDEAKKQAEKLIGATWDVGHINMMKQYGYEDKDIIKETETIAKYVNKVHLSDNFGMEHTELPMGMGNVPMPEHLKELKKAHGEKLDKIKKVIEAGDWYQHFQTNPFKKTMEAFGSPIYGMEMAPYWNQTPKMNNGYFGGYGMMLPEGHFSMYGSGFSSLPTELGGQMSGRSRVSGNAME